MDDENKDIELLVRLKYPPITREIYESYFSDIELIYPAEIVEVLQNERRDDYEDFETFKRVFINELIKYEQKYGTWIIS